MKLKKILCLKKLIIMTNMQNKICNFKLDLQNKGQKNKKE